MLRADHAPADWARANAPSICGRTYECRRSLIDRRERRIRQTTRQARQKFPRPWFSTRPPLAKTRPSPGSRLRKLSDLACCKAGTARDACSTARGPSSGPFSASRGSARRSGAILKLAAGLVIVARMGTKQTPREASVQALRSTPLVELAHGHRTTSFPPTYFLPT